MKTVDELVAFSAQVDGQGTEDHQNCTYTQAELRALANQLYICPLGSRIVEIGVYSGRSTSLYLQLATENPSMDIHLIDNWSWAASLSAHLFVDLILKHFSDVSFTLHKTLSGELGKTWNLPIDFLHIDGWHDMPGIEPDCRLWLPWVRVGGFAAFHDSDCGPVSQCIAKYCAGWELVETAFRTTVWRKPLA